MGSWGCPHEVNGVCSKVNSLTCDPGMKGCVRAGKYVFANDEAKNARLRAKRAQSQQTALDDVASPAAQPDTR